MKYKLICTSYTEEKVGDSIVSIKLKLRNNWIEEHDDTTLPDLFEKWNISLDFKYPSVNSISDILEGTMEIGCPIHVRIVRFS